MQGAPDPIPSRPAERLDVRIEFPGIRAVIAVTGATSNVGKTRTCEESIRALVSAGHRVAALKVTRAHLGDACPRGVSACGTCTSLDEPFRIVTDPAILATPKKDTARYLEAGAHRVMWLLVRPSAMRVGIIAALSQLEPGVILVAEGNSFRDFASADVTLMAWSRRFPAKSSALAILDRLDGCVERPDLASLNNGTEFRSPNLSVPQVPPDEIGAFVLKHVASRLIARP